MFQVWCFWGKQRLGVGAATAAEFCPVFQVCIAGAPPPKPLVVGKKRTRKSAKSYRDRRATESGAAGGGNPRKSDKIDSVHSARIYEHVHCCVTLGEGQLKLAEKWGPTQEGQWPCLGLEPPPLQSGGPKMWSQVCTYKMVLFREFSFNKIGRTFLS